MLAARARSARGPYRDRLQAAIVLAPAADQANAAIARQLGVYAGTVRRWRRWFAEGRLAGQHPALAWLVEFTADISLCQRRPALAFSASQ